MKSNVLRAPLIKSAIILVIFCLLVYFTITSPEGSVWASIGKIFFVAFTTIQWAFALAIGLIISLAVMFGIFIGAVALFSPASASRMYEGLRETLLTWFTPVIDLFKSDREEKLAATLDSFGIELKNEITADIHAAQAGLKKTQAELEAKLGSLSSRLATLEETTTGLAAGEEVENLAEEIKATLSSTAEIKSTVDSLKSSVEQINKQIQEVSGKEILGDLPGRIEALEQQEIPEPQAAVDIAPLKKDIAALQSELATVQEKTEKAVEAATEQPANPVPDENADETKEAQKAEAKASQEEEHRIFSYFDDPADKNKVAELVDSTLKKDMNYKQAMDFVAKKLGGKKGEIITSHPSLSKDYIRQCRRKG